MKVSSMEQKSVARVMVCLGRAVAALAAQQSGGDAELLRQIDKMWEAARELVALNPMSQAGLYQMTVLAPTAKERWEEGEKAARTLLDNLGEFESQRERVAMETAARRTLGWVAMMQKKPVKAEEEFMALLKANPSAGGQISYWLGTSMVA